MSSRFASSRPSGDLREPIPREGLGLTRPAKPARKVIRSSSYSRRLERPGRSLATASLRPILLRSTKSRVRRPFIEGYRLLLLDETGPAEPGPQEAKGAPAH